MYIFLFIFYYIINMPEKSVFYYYYIVYNMILLVCLKNVDAKSLKQFTGCWLKILALIFVIVLSEVIIYHNFTIFIKIFSLY